MLVDDIVIDVPIMGKIFSIDGMYYWEGSYYPAFNSTDDLILWAVKSITENRYPVACIISESVLENFGEEVVVATVLKEYCE